MHSKMAVGNLKSSVFVTQKRHYSVDAFPTDGAPKVRPTRDSPAGTNSRKVSTRAHSSLVLQELSIDVRFPDVGIKGKNVTKQLQDYYEVFIFSQMIFPSIPKSGERPFSGSDMVV